MGAGGPAVALEHAVKRLRAIVEMLVPAEHADQEIRRELACQPGDGVDLRTLKIAAECVAVEICTTHVNPSEPLARRSGGRPRRLGHQPVGTGIAERAETIFDIFAASIR